MSAPSSFHDLYDEAFARYAATVLWFRRRLRYPSAADAAVIARDLRQGDLHARALAEELERACGGSH